MKVTTFTFFTLAVSVRRATANDDSSNLEFGSSDDVAGDDAFDQVFSDMFGVFAKCAPDSISSLMNIYSPVSPRW